MSDWRENSNGNFVYVIDTDDVMTVFERAGLWFGVYDNRFIEDGLSTPEKAMAFMEMAVLNEQLHLLKSEHLFLLAGVQLKLEAFIAIEMAAL